MKTQNSPFLLIIIGFTFILIGSFTFSLLKENEQLNNKIDSYESIYLKKEFDDIPTGNAPIKIIRCDIRSFDGGINWYSVEESKEKGIIILGKAEMIYPDVFPIFMNLDQQRDSVIQTINK